MCLTKYGDFREYVAVIVFIDDVQVKSYSLGI